MSDAVPSFDPESPSPLPAHVMNALPDFALAVWFLAIWIAPQRMPAGSVHWALLTMLLEFIVVHSAAFMGMQVFADGPRGPRLLRIVGLGLFYSMFAGGFSLGFHTWWPLASFWGLTLNRMLGVLLGGARGSEREFVQKGWSASVAAYVLGVFATLILPLPALGLTPAVLAAVHLPGRGIWVQQPWRVIAFGTLYYGLVGWSEATGHKLVKLGPMPTTPAQPPTSPAA